MLSAISNTSPLLYLYRIEGIEWLPELFGEIWVPEAVKTELLDGRKKGYDVPNLINFSWLKNSVDCKFCPYSTTAIS